MPDLNVWCCILLFLCTLGTICGGTVLLNNLEKFGRPDADEKSISRQMPGTCKFVKRSTFLYNARLLRSQLDLSDDVSSW